MSQILDLLGKTRAQTLKYFDLPEKDLAKTYGPGKWNVKFILCHLADSEAVLAYRVRRIISEPQQVIWFYNQDAWAQHLDYSTFPLSLSRKVYEISRETTTYFAERHYEGSGAKAYVHSLDGLKTLKDQFHSVVDHNQHHLDQIAQALSR